MSDDYTDDEELDGEPECECGHVQDEHVSTGSQECAVEKCECVAFEEA